MGGWLSIGFGWFGLGGLCGYGWVGWLGGAAWPAGSIWHVQSRCSIEITPTWDIPVGDIGRVLDSNARGREFEARQGHPYLMVTEGRGMGKTTTHFTFFFSLKGVGRSWRYCNGSNPLRSGVG